MRERDARLFLRSLREEGVEALYWEPSAQASSPAPVPAGQDTRPGTEQKAPAEKRPQPDTSADREPKSQNAADHLRESMLEIYWKAQNCQLCSELCSTRNKVVFGAGNLRAPIVFVGEAPGRDEDEQGLPFVGRAGQILTALIEEMGFARKDVFICNTLKCRPPKNRPPQPEEIANCRPFLERQLELIRPKVICALGTFAAQTLLKTEEPISALRGKLHNYQGTPLMATYHPAYLLRNPSEKVKVSADLKLLKQELERL
ncbi:MAG: uracil-DNA glycosylase [Candidatus Omnitrophica bacterium]|nr:uracil-DNA glycosylase [Candidatus Omnitrophota bacterium]